MVHKAKMDQKEAEDFVRQIGDQIRKVRTERGLTQETLGELAALNSNYVGQIERGEKSISAYTLKKIVDGLGLSLEEFFQQVDPAERKDVLGEIFDLLIPLSSQEQELILNVIRSVVSWEDYSRGK